MTWFTGWFSEAWFSSTVGVGILLNPEVLEGRVTLGTPTALASAGTLAPAEALPVLLGLAAPEVLTAANLPADLLTFALTPLPAIAGGETGCDVEALGLWMIRRLPTVRGAAAAALETLAVKLASPSLDVVLETAAAIDLLDCKISQTAPNILGSAQAESGTVQVKLTLPCKGLPVVIETVVIEI